MELRSQAKVSGSQTRPRATSQGRTQLRTNRLDDTLTTLVIRLRHPLESPGTGRKLPASSPQRVVSSGPSPHDPVVRVREELTRHPKGTRPVAEGKVGGAATRTSGRELELAADTNGKHLRLPDEGHTEFTHILASCLTKVLIHI